MLMPTRNYEKSLLALGTETGRTAHRQQPRHTGFNQLRFVNRLIPLSSEQPELKTEKHNPVQQQITANSVSAAYVPGRAVS